MNTDTALIFGASGQDGVYMARLCRSKGITPIGIARRPGFNIQGSVSDTKLVEALVQNHKPGFIFHFAANSTTRHDALFENHETISTGTLNILESVKKYSPTTRVLITGSGVQFKNTGEPISEKSEFEAWNAYAVSRIQSVYAARYFRQLGMKVYVAYLFHHESPFRQDHHVSKIICNQISDILDGKILKLKLGDPYVKKEWGFAGDIVDGIFTLVNQDIVFEACVGTGVEQSIYDFLSICFDLVDLSLQRNFECKDFYASQYARLVSCPKIIESLGWKSKTDLRDLAKMMLNFEKKS